MARTTTKISAAGGDKLTAVTRVYSDPAWKEVAGKAADEEGIPLSEFIVRIIAKQLGRPELGTIPRKKMGRPRKQAV